MDYQNDNEIVWNLNMKLQIANGCVIHQITINLCFNWSWPIQDFQNHLNYAGNPDNITRGNQEHMWIPSLWEMWLQLKNFQWDMLQKAWAYNWAVGCHAAECRPVF
jgi:hypothetical protein